MTNVIRIFGFLKKHPTRGIRIDHRPVEVGPKYTKMKIDSGRQYLDFK